nr:MAG TPA: Caspase 3 [Herelleviridae sp.]
MINSNDVIEKDLQVLPWLKLYNFDACRLKATYIDEIRQDLYDRYISDKDMLVLYYVGHITYYHEVKLDKEKEN